MAGLTGVSMTARPKQRSRAGVGAIASRGTFSPTDTSSPPPLFTPYWLIEQGHGPVVSQSPSNNEQLATASPTARPGGWPGSDSNAQYSQAPEDGDASHHEHDQEHGGQDKTHSDAQQPATLSTPAWAPNLSTAGGPQASQTQPGNDQGHDQPQAQPTSKPTTKPAPLPAAGQQVKFSGQGAIPASALPK